MIVQHLGAGVWFEGVPITTGLVSIWRMLEIDDSNTIVLIIVGAPENATVLFGNHHLIIQHLDP